jgi:hypothetical protein
MTDTGLRVLIADLPALLRDIVVSAVEAHPSTRRVTVLHDDDDLARAVREIDPQVVITAASGGGLSPTAQATLDARCRFVVVAIDAADGHATVHRLRPEHVVLGAVALDDLLATLDTVADSSP